MGEQNHPGSMDIGKLIKKDKVLSVIVAVEILILLCLIIKAFVGEATALSFSGEAFFDNIRDYETITKDGADVVFESMPAEQQADLEHGVNIYSYEFALRSGAYVVTVEYESSGGDPMEYILSTNGYLGFRSRIKESTAKYEDLYLDDQHDRVMGRLYIPAFSSLSDLQLFIHYDGPGKLRIKSITITEQSIYRFMQALGFLLCFIVFDLIYFFLFSPLFKESKIDFKTKGRARTMLVATATVVFASAPFFMGYLFRGHDILYHLNRIEAIAAAMRYHRIPVRIQSDVLLGFGYSLPLYYCDIFLYPVAFLYEYCMIPLRICYQIYGISINILTAYASYRCCRTIFRDRDMATIGMFLYSLSLYCLTNVHLRAALGEYTAYAFLPLALEGVYRIYTSEKPGIWDWMPLTMGMMGMLESHLVTAMMAAFFIFVFVLAKIRKLTIRRVMAFVKAASAVLLLTAWFFVPMVESLKVLKPVVTEISSRIQWTGAYVLQIFQIIPGGYGISKPGMTGDMPLGIGGGLTAGFFLLVLYYLTRNIDRARDNEGMNSKTINACFALGLLAIWMSSAYFPRDLIARILIGRFDAARSMLEVMETVWRHLTLGTLFISVAVVSLLYAIRNRDRKTYIALTGMIAFLTIISDMSFYRDFAYECPQDAYIEMNNDEKAYLDMSADYDLEWGMTRQIMDNYVITDGTDIEVISYGNDGADRIMECVNSGSDADAIVPLFDFAHYHAYDTDSGIELRVKRSDVHARLAVEVPGGYKGSIRIAYVPPMYWHVMELISLISWLGLIVYWIYCLRTKNALD